MNLFAGQKLRHRCREQTYGHQGGKAAVGGGGGVMICEIEIDMYTLMCIKLMTNKNLLYKKINKIKFRTKKVICDNDQIKSPFIEKIKYTMIVFQEKKKFLPPSFMYYNTKSYDVTEEKE